MKITIEQLQHYPMGENGLLVNYFGDFWRMEGVNADCNSVIASMADCINRDFYPNDIKPYFHPLSDLTEEGEYGGKRFVPAHILWRIGSIGLENPFTKPPCGWYEGELECVWSEEDYVDILTITPIDDKRYSTLEISFCTGPPLFCVGETGMALEQFQLFQRLFQWRFWIYGQKYFDEGLILDIKTMKL